jgi:hypothetical protein
MAGETSHARRTVMAVALVCLSVTLMPCSSSVLSESRMRLTPSSLSMKKGSCVLRTLCLRGGSGAPRMGDNGAVPLVKPMGGLRRTNSYSALTEILLTGEKSGHTGQSDTAPAEEPPRQAFFAVHASVAFSISLLRNDTHTKSWSILSSNHLSLLLF